MRTWFGAKKEPAISHIDGLVRPLWRGRLHLWAFLVSVAAAPVLLVGAESISATVGLAVYAISLMALFGTSAAYHRLARTEQAQRIMRRWDHAMIFVLIAGTYTPVCLIALPRAWGIPIMVAIWGSAAAGMLIKLFAGYHLMRISNGLYIVFGWIAVIALPVILRHLTTTEFALLATGGVLYTVGAILFALRQPRLLPSVFGYHEVWHGFTIVAAFAHFGMIWSVAS